MEAGTIVKWLKSEGEPVEKGEPLYELDTDKVTQEVESDFAGTLLKIAIAEGEVAVGKTIGVIGEEGEEVSIAEPEAAEKVTEEKRGAEGGPRARARSAEAVGGTGRSCQGVPARTPDSEGARDRSRGGARDRPGGPDRGRGRRARGGRAGDCACRGVSRRGRAARADEHEADNRQAPDRGMDGPCLSAAGFGRHDPGECAGRAPAEAEQHVTVTDVLVKVSAAALMQHREVNVQWTEDAILLHPNANVGIAVAAPQGLIVPVIRGAERLRLAEISAARAELVGRAREGKLTREDLEGGTFTISNLGMFAVESFTAVLNPPQAAIVAVGATEDRVVAVGGEPAVRPMMTLVATFDHRAVDGAPAAGFLQTLKSYLEEPGLAL